MHFLFSNGGSTFWRFDREPDEYTFDKIHSGKVITKVAKGKTLGATGGGGGRKGKKTPTVNQMKKKAINYKVQDLKDCQNKYEFLDFMMNSARPGTQGKTNEELVDEYIAKIDKDIEELLDSAYSILPTFYDYEKWTTCR